MAFSDPTTEIDPDLRVDTSLQREERYDLVDAARQAWEARQDFRVRRRRSRNYYRSDQWETYTDPETGEVIDESEKIRKSGRIDWVMNQIRAKIDNLLGQFLQNKSGREAYPRNKEDAEAARMMTNRLQYSQDLNEAEEQDADQFLEALLSGAFGWKMQADFWEDLGRTEPTIEPIDQTRLFYNPDFRDVYRKTDLTFIGEIHDVTMDEVVRAFARSPQEQQQLEELYAQWHAQREAKRNRWDSDDFGFDATDALSFFYPVNQDQYVRLIEVWQKEYDWITYMHDPLEGTFKRADMTQAELQMENQERTRMAQEQGLPAAPVIRTEEKYEATWNAYYLTPSGHVLDKQSSPYAHGKHPYSFGFARFLDGEVWGMVEEMIDPQRYLNRMFSAMDFKYGASAKGLLMYPEEMIPEGMTKDDINDKWTKFDQTLFYSADKRVGNAKPEQVTSDGFDDAAASLYQIVKQELSDITGITESLQGYAPDSGTPAARYHREIMQASLTNLVYFHKFYKARKDRDERLLKLILEYGNQSMNIPGERPGKVSRFDPQKIADIEWTVVMADVSDTAAYRQLFEQELRQDLDAGRITYQQFLQLSSSPLASRVQAVIERTNPLLQQGEMPPEFLEAAAQGDPDAITMLNQAQ